MLPSPGTTTTTTSSRQAGTEAHWSPNHTHTLTQDSRVYQVQNHNGQQDANQCTATKMTGIMHTQIAEASRVRETSNQITGQARHKQSDARPVQRKKCSSFQTSKNLLHPSAVQKHETIMTVNLEEITKVEHHTDESNIKKVCILNFKPLRTSSGNKPILTQSTHTTYSNRSCRCKSNSPGHSHWNPTPLLKY